MPDDYSAAARLRAQAKLTGVDVLGKPWRS